MKSIAAQAEELGLQIPTNCSARVIRQMGFEVPDYIADCEIMVHDFCFQQRSSFAEYHTGYTWVWPMGFIVWLYETCFFVRAENGISHSKISVEMLRSLSAPSSRNCVIPAEVYLDRDGLENWVQKRKDKGDEFSVCFFAGSPGADLLG